ncbi:hypothetical protein KFL_000260060 [Klebsormidium nitens]|uniref:Prolyl 4-hydroxylase alpha subunit Fe(2+) 2OG dioxygenase domain-containing protein n=1 Tax=Klebsormidium nitens TaxID=105231 RepID=A0A1Y1HQC8_KLENI|nr:hypothetical protein KFL_000260060 [Klebsormidium nitens]|eukprot:GAQ79191.1 hypothetical protein KFL_000260060 [Klebsormidium nitens]
MAPDPVKTKPQAGGGEGPSKLLDMCCDALLDQIGSDAEKLTATFCYAGAVEIPSGGLKIFYVQSKNGMGQPKMLDVPLKGGKEDEFQDLMSACEEATFGRMKEDVLDPSYRTGDFFKSHVDTPRREDMFGSLVVCLPFEHEGGELHIRRGSVTSVIDWSSKSGSAIQWVALYSDCEHEVKEVTRHYRVTLTYNLYADARPAPERPFGPSSDMRHVRLYQTLLNSLSQQSFMYDGGRLGFMCQHRYPHTSHAFAERPAPLLKGADAVLFADAKTLGLHVRFVHLYKLEGDTEGEEEPETDADSDGEEVAPRRIPATSQTGTGADVVSQDEELKADGFKVVRKTKGAVTQRRFTKGRVTGYGNGLIDVLAPLSGLDYTHRTNMAHAHEFRYTFTSMTEERQKDIEWCIGHSKFWDVGKFGVAEGNEPSINYYYCAAAMLVTVPKWGEEREKIFRQVE